MSKLDRILSNESKLSSKQIDLGAKYLTMLNLGSDIRKIKSIDDISRAWNQFSSSVGMEIGEDGLDDEFTEWKSQLNKDDAFTLKELRKKLTGFDEEK